MGIRERDVSAEQAEAEKCKVCGNKKTDTPERQRNMTAYTHTECHWPNPVCSCPVWIVYRNGEVDQIGTGFYCPEASCYKPVRFGGRSMVGNKNLPPGFNQSVWNQAKSHGAVYRTEQGFGFYFGRKEDESLCVLDSGGPGLNFAAVKAWMEKNTEIQSHGLFRKEMMAQNAYQQEL